MPKPERKPNKRIYQIPPQLFTRLPNTAFPLHYDNDKHGSGQSEHEESQHEGSRKSKKDNV